MERLLYAAPAMDRMSVGDTLLEETFWRGCRMKDLMLVVGP